MSSSDTSHAATLHQPLCKTLVSVNGAPPADRQRQFRQPRKSRQPVVSRANAMQLLRYTLRLFVLSCVLYALYTLALYLMFRDRLFYSLFIARSLML